jgi:deoxyribodipyrimidine photolyase-related protein
MRTLVFVLGDQLSLDAPALRAADPAQDVVCMAEVADEVQRYPNHRQRVVLFFSAMRHFRDRLRERGFLVHYQTLSEEGADSLPAFFRQQIEAHAPERAALTEPGRYDLREALREVAEDARVPITVCEDDHFLCTHDEFAGWVDGRKQLTMEYFYRELRQRYGVLMDGDAPAGGDWNYDKENREAFRSDGPPDYKAPIQFRPDDLTQAVMAEVEEHFPDLYGSLDGFAWPVTHEEAQRAVRDFVEHRLSTFGTHQDAMWMDRAWLSHARIAAALNLKLIDPRYVIQKAEDAYRAGHAPINAVEGFIRQVLGWREFIRGVYWHHMPDYADRNALDAQEELPDFFWTGETDMTCVRQVVTQLLEHAYAHHIQRLMVTGLFALLYGIVPRQIHDWYMALYVDSVEWVTLPNTIGMSQYADGGIIGTKPYIASGQYIDRMSNYCTHCRYQPKQAHGDDACPFTTLYWEFLMRHGERFETNRRMRFQVRNLERKSDQEREKITARARNVRQAIQAGEL